MARADSPEVLERFHAGLPLAEIVARQVLRTIGGLVELDDLLSAGREGLLDAARRYEPERDIPFRAYANVRIRGAVLDAVRRMAPLSRRAYERALGLEATWLVSEAKAELLFLDTGRFPQGGSDEGSADGEPSTSAIGAAAELLASGLRTSFAAEDGEAEDPEQAFARAELLARIERELGEDFPRAEADVLRAYYFEGLTIEAVAVKLCINRGFTSRLHTRGLARLTKRLRGAT